METYVTLGSGGCSVDVSLAVLTYFNFVFQALPEPGNSNPATLVASASSVNVTPPGGLGEQMIFDSADFYVGSGDRVVYLIAYTIDPPPDILPGFDLEMFTDTPVSPGKATIKAFICAGGNFGFPCQAVEGATDPEPIPYFVQVFHNGLPDSFQLQAEVEFNKPTNYVSVLMFIDLDAREGGSSQITGLGSSTQAPPQEVPEPGMLALMGGGLAALGLARRLKTQ